MGKSRCLWELDNLLGKRKCLMHKEIIAAEAPTKGEWWGENVVGGEGGTIAHLRNGVVKDPVKQASRLGRPGWGVARGGQTQSTVPPRLGHGKFHVSGDVRRSRRHPRRDKRQGGEGPRSETLGAEGEFAETVRDACAYALTQQQFKGQKSTYRAGNKAGYMCPLRKRT